MMVQPFCSGTWRACCGAAGRGSRRDRNRLNASDQTITKSMPTSGQIIAAVTIDNRDIIFCITQTTPTAGTKYRPGDDMSTCFLKNS
jgi:hypothetical protein